MLSPRFVGERFLQHEIPLSVLRDLATLESLVLESAKIAYRESHPEAQRLPKGFLRGTYLSLGQIQAGSAVPVLELRQMAKQRTLPDFCLWEESIKAGMKKMCEIIESANQGKLSGIDPKLASKFAALGANLQRGERIEFWGDEDCPIIFDSKSRESFFLASNDDSFEVQRQYTGQVTGCFRETGVFMLRAISGELLEVPYSDEESDLIQKLLWSYKTEDWKYVRIDCVSRREKNSKFRIERMLDLEILEKRHVPSRLEELIYLKKGWHYGEGNPFPDEEIRRLADLFTRHYPQELPLPYTYPDLEQTVRFEWEFGNSHIQLEVQVVSLEADLYVFDLDSEEEPSEKNMNMQQEASWVELCKVVSLCKMKGLNHD